MNRFHLLTGIGIEDDLTGEIYNTKIAFTHLLNHMNDKADENAEKFTNIKYYIEQKIRELEDEHKNNEEKKLPNGSCEVKLNLLYEIHQQIMKEYNKS